MDTKSDIDYLAGMNKNEYSRIINMLEDDETNPSINIVARNLVERQRKVDSLEIKALKEKYSDLFAKVVRFNDPCIDPKFSLDNDTNISPEGKAQNLIAVVNIETASKLDQLKSILKATLEPFIEAKKGIENDITLISFGGANVSQEIDKGKVFRDIDLCAFIQGETFVGNEELYSSMSTGAKIIYDKFRMMITEGWKGGLIEFTIVGDTLTSDHTLEIAFETSSNFANSLKLEGVDKNLVLERAFGRQSEKEPQKAKKHKDSQMTIFENMAKNGTVIYGKNILDGNGKDIFDKTMIIN